MGIIHREMKRVCLWDVTCLPPCSPGHLQPVTFPSAHLDCPSTGYSLPGYHGRWQLVPGHRFPPCLITLELQFFVPFPLLVLMLRKSQHSPLPCYPRAAGWHTGDLGPKKLQVGIRRRLGYPSVSRQDVAFSCCSDG